jgi:hypothetical protein
MLPCNIDAVVIINLWLLEVRTLDGSLGELAGIAEKQNAALCSGMKRCIGLHVSVAM